MNYAVILAGGYGIRFNSKNLPKQFVALTGMPMLVYSMKTAERNVHIDEICVVTLEEYIPQVWTWGERYGISKLKYVAKAGEKRFDSVYSGICSIPAQDMDTVIIMTAVCPFLSQDTINKHYALMERHDGVITVVDATDAITASDDGYMADRTLQKEKLFVQQGPQTYRYSELVLRLRVPVAMVKGDRFCIKVTYPEDLAIAQALYPLFSEKENRQEMGI